MRDARYGRCQIWEMVGSWHHKLPRVVVLSAGGDSVLLSFSPSLPFSLLLNHQPRGPVLDLYNTTDNPLLHPTPIAHIVSARLDNRGVAVLS